MPLIIETNTKGGTDRKRTATKFSTVYLVKYFNFFATLFFANLCSVLYNRKDSKQNTKYHYIYIEYRHML